MKDSSHVRRFISRAITGASAAILGSTPAYSIDFDFGVNQEVSGRLNMTVGYATSFRAEDRDPDINALGVNELSELRVPDKGDRVSQILSGAFELGVDWKNYGLVASGSYQYDTEIMDGDSIDPLSTTLLTGMPGMTGEPGPWSKAAEDYAGNNFDTLDAYVYGTFYLEDNPLDIRLGKQVINWGEGLYFLDGVSTQVPLNFNKLVTPGSELKEGYIGNNALYAMLGIGGFSSIAAYIQTEWNRAELPPQGTFYGYDPFYRGGAEAIPGLGVGYRDGDQGADDHGQWGISGRTLIGDIELGLYYSRYHETLAYYESTADPESVQAAINALGVQQAQAAGISDAQGNPIACNLTSVLCTRQIWPEDIDMFGASFATSVSTFALAGEIAYRPNRPLMTTLGPGTIGGVGAFGVSAGETSIEEHDTINASVNAIWLGGRAPMGIDSQTLVSQVGLDYIDGDTSGLAPNYTVTRRKSDPKLPTQETADSVAYGALVEWTGTWQAIFPATNLSLTTFVQHDIKGISHFYGNFAEGRTLGAVTLTTNIGNTFEASLGYSMTDHNASDYEDLDTYNFAMNYKF